MFKSFALIAALLLPLSATATNIGGITTQPDITPAPFNGVTALSVDYRPSFSPLGEYSTPACKVAIDEAWPQVTLHENGQETLKAAHTRLLAKGRANGILNIRWDAPPAMCDTLFGGASNRMAGTLVIRGLTGPNGEQPRFYCRSDIRDGNVPHKTLPGTVLDASGKSLTVIENLHVDGYKKVVQTPMEGRLVVRNNYMHHQVSDAIGGSNIKAEKVSVTYEFCGNEMSHSGRDNGSHLFYIHRGLADTSNITAIWVDNFLHSAANSSAIKSIANTNVVVGNRITKQIATDPTYTPRMTQFLVDLAGCSNNLIESNLLEGPKLARAAGGKDLIGIRNRKTELNGCGSPKVGSAKWNDPVYWDGVRADKPFKTVIKNNTFRTRPAEFTAPAFDNKLTAIRDWGTWPNTGPGMRDDRVLLNVPAGYVEQHEVLVSGNTYIGPFEELYGSNNIEHCKVGVDLRGYGICPPYPNPGPVTPANYFKVGQGESKE